MLTADELTRQIEQLSTDIGTTRSFVHGAEDETVLLGNVPTPSLRNLVNNIKSLIVSMQTDADGAVSLATVQAEIATAQALIACDCATESAESAREAADIVAALPGFAENAWAFFGLRLNDKLQLVQEVTEAGDIMDTLDYDYTDYLPARCRFELLGNGRLALIDLFAPQP